MPIRIEEARTPKGQRMMRANVSGFVTLADAQSMGNLLQPGQPFHGGLVLTINDKSTEYHPDARRHFPTFRGSYQRHAAVVTGVLVRAAINFMVRVTGGDDSMKIFSTEAEAIDWLDS